MKELVSCLVQIGGLEEAKAYLRLHARSEIRRLVQRVVEAWAQQQRSKLRGGLGISLAGEGLVGKVCVWEAS
jgi:hypothetical protein